MADEKLDVGINFNVTGNADAADFAFEVAWDEKHRAELARALEEDDQLRIAALDVEHDRDFASDRAERASVTARSVTSETDATIRATQAAVEAGALSEAQGRELVIASYVREKRALLAALDAAMALAAISGPPEDAADVDQLTERYLTVQREIMHTQGSTRELPLEDRRALARQP